MRESRDPYGPLPARVWYEESEIEGIVDNELARASSPRTAAGRAIDIDRFVEMHLGITPEFVALPPGILGATEFAGDGSVRMLINGALANRAADSAAGETLLRSTLAHEAGHALLHRALFLRETAAIFGREPARQELCRDIDAAGAGQRRDWWEWQANRAMGALLLPRADVAAFIIEWRRSNPGRRGVTALSEGMGHAFGVSRQVARLRVQQLDQLGQAVASARGRA